MASVIKIILSTLALLASTPALAAPLNARQLAGEGAAANSILSSTDNGVGYGIENAEDNTAALITSLKGGAPATPPLAARSLLHEVTMLKRQADKIANGAAAVLDAAGVPAAGDAVKSNGDSIDGALTSGAANAGASIGNTEETTLEQIGSSIP